MLTVCPKCQTPRSGVLPICPSCGFDYRTTPAATLTTCPQCQTARTGLLPICPSCGFDYRTGTAGATVTGSSTPEATDRSSLYLGLAAILFIVAVGGALGFYFGRAQTPGRTTTTAATSYVPTASRVLTTTAPAEVATSAATATSTAVPGVAATPQVLLSFSGNGIKNSQPFTASGDTVQVVYSFDCSAFGSQGNFQADLVGSDGLPNSIANALAASGKDTTTIYLHGMSGPYHVEVNSECSWSLTVSGRP